MIETRQCQGLGPPTIGKANCMRILVADSHITVRSALRRLLQEELELQLVGEVTRAKDLLEQTQLAEPDVVLFEWGLLDRNLTRDDDAPGATLRARRMALYQLHALPCHPNLVALSAWPEAQQAALLAGADAFVNIGNPPAQLLATLRAVTSRRRARQRQQIASTETIEGRTGQTERTMEIKNYRDVKAEELEPGIMLRWLISELDEAPNFAMKLYEFEPDAISAMHTHPWEDEVFVLSGQGAIMSAESRTDIGEGDVVYIPPREPHQFVNTGQRKLRLLMMVPRPDQVTLAAGATL